MMNREIAILIAAGKGERLRPLTLKCPKPLIRVNNMPMIETMINALQERGISHIYIVVGYLEDQFEYLKEKYHNISLIHNNEYMDKNNISSIYAARDILGKFDSFICEADIVVSDSTIFKTSLSESCYFGKMVSGYSADWIFEQDKNGRVIHIGKGGTDCYNMCGVCFLKASDCKKIKSAVIEAYRHPGEYEQLYWDEIVDRELIDIKMMVNPVRSDQIFEIDTEEELKRLDSNYLNYNQGIENEC